jgi:hypothetical protein
MNSAWSVEAGSFPPEGSRRTTGAQGHPTALDHDLGSRIVRGLVNRHVSPGTAPIDNKWSDCPVCVPACPSDFTISRTGTFFVATGSGLDLYPGSGPSMAGADPPSV